jgi:hypothetical protein
MIKLRTWAAVLLAAWSVYVWRVVLPAAQATTNGFAAYYTAAHLLAREPESLQHVYDDAWFAARVERAGFPGLYDIFNVQPPTMGLMLLPLAWLPPASARIAWIAFSLLLLPAGLHLLARALALPARWAAWALPFCLLYAPFTENLRQAQAYALLFFLLCLLFWSVLRGHERLAGTALALMLVLKSAGLWLWPLLVWGPCRRVVRWAALMAAALALATLPWITAGAWAAYTSHLPRLATMPERTVTAYQTVTSLFGHLFVFHPTWNPAPVLHSPLLAGTLTLGVVGGSLVLSACCTRGSPTLALALFGALLAPTVPVAEGHHYLLVLPSLLVAAWHAQRSTLGWRAWAVLLVAALLLGTPLPYKSPHLQAGWLALFAYPRVYGAYLLWAWLVWQASGLGVRSRLEAPAQYAV